MSKPRKPSVDRRNFLKTAAAGAAAAVAAPGAVAGQTATPAAQGGAAAGSSAPAGNASAPLVGRPGPAAEGVAEAKVIERAGSDFMVDVIKSLGFEYIFAVPANTFLGLQESIINYGKNSMPEFITATNED